MKIKKIIIFILAMLVIFSVPTSYAKDAIPAGSANKEEIAKYVKKNGTDKVSIDTLCKWYNTVGSDTSLIPKIDQALQSKSTEQIAKYCKGKTKNYLKKNVPLKILENWQKLNTGTNVQEKITKAYKEKKQNQQEAADKVTEGKRQQTTQVTDPTQNQDMYKPGTASSTKIQGKVGPILGIIRNIGIVLSVIFLMIIGVQAMLGSAEERADYKKRLPKYLIGVIVLLAGSVIPQIIYNVMK